MKKSTIFWNSIYIIFMITIGFISLEGLLIIMLINSFASFAFLDGSIDEKHFSVAINPLILLVLIIVGVVLLFKFVYDNTILKFNHWMDGEKRIN